jgi:hypothetical protein
MLKKGTLFPREFARWDAVPGGGPEKESGQMAREIPFFNNKSELE